MNYYISSYILNKTSKEYHSEYNNENIETSYKNIGFNHLRSEAIQYLLKSESYLPCMLKNEDLLANLIAAIWRAKYTFDISIGSSVEERIASFVKWEISKYKKFKTKQQKNKCLQIHKSQFYSDAIDNNEFIKKAMNIANKETKSFINDRFYNKASISKIAKTNKVSTSYVNKSLDRFYKMAAKLAFPKNCTTNR